jgi:DNA-binding transcriptional LysR family regulator
MMDLQLLRSFLEVVDRGSISAAARHLLLTQPALSRRLQQLERELGAPLLERSRKGVVPTAEGRLVREEGGAILERWERMREDVGALSKLEGGTVRVGGGATAVSFLLPPAIADFQRSHPGVLFQVKEAGSRDVEIDVASEHLDLGIVTLPVRAREFEITPLPHDRIVLVAAADHPLAHLSRIPVRALEGQDLVGFESPSAIRALIDGALREAGVRMHVVMELRSIPAILQMVATTRCLAFVSHLGVRPGDDEVKVLAVTGLRIDRRLAVIRKHDRPLSSPAAAFADRLRRARPGRVRRK